MPAPSSPPATEGELYDRLKELFAECVAIEEAVDERTAELLRRARVEIQAATSFWVAQS
jgi:hypothetical protein